VFGHSLSYQPIIIMRVPIIINHTTEHLIDCYTHLSNSLLRYDYEKMGEFRKIWGLREIKEKYRKFAKNLGLGQKIKNI
jgi:hypothetical protein